MKQKKYVNKKIKQKRKSENQIKKIFYDDKN